MSVTTQARTARSQKAARRSPNTWVDGHPQVRAVRRASSSPSKSDLIRFPLTGPDGNRSSRVDAVANRLTTVQATWSDREREQRRLQAIRKQEELLMMLVDAALEDDMRLAVADGEQPILPPEIEVLRN